MLELNVVFALTSILCCTLCSSQNVLSTIEESIDQSGCGGPLEADMDFLAYPRPGQTVQPGQLCVWTIHLPTTNAFELSLPTLNINSNSTAQCEDGSIGIYSLTNLVSTENLGSFTFCDGNPPPETFYLIESVVAVVFYAGSNPSSFTRFTLSWSGIAFSPIPITHVTSYSTSSSGLIRFPIDDEYEPSTIATWLVKTDGNDLELNLTSLSVEPCTNLNDPCVCDALILYEITESGILSESDRFCGERTSAVKESISPNFILAFYSDFNSIPAFGKGFELLYKPITDGTSTTTEPTPTEPPRPSTPCGSIIDMKTSAGEASVEGHLIYKADEYYSGNERCTWTLRSSRTTMMLRLEEEGFETGDEVFVDMFLATADPNITDSWHADPHTGTAIFNRGNVGFTYTGNGSLGIVTFVSGENSRGKGFVLWYRSEGDLEEVGLFNQDVIEATAEGRITKNSLYNDMLSSFVLPPVNYTFHPDTKKQLIIYTNELETCGVIHCCDSLRLYTFTSHTGLINVNEFCGTSSWGFDSQDTFVIILKTDISVPSTGFNISWTSESVPARLDF